MKTKATIICGSMEEGSRGYVARSADLHFNNTLHHKSLDPELSQPLYLLKHHVIRSE